MSKENYEKEQDDEVYEDDYFEKDEELEDEEDYKDDDKDDLESDSDDDDEEVHEKKIHVSFACEDCDYRWDDVIIKTGNNLEDQEEDFEGICPMCGTNNVSQI